MANLPTLGMQHTKSFSIHTLLLLVRNILLMITSLASRSMPLQASPSGYSVLCLFPSTSMISAELTETCTLIRVQGPIFHHKIIRLSINLISFSTFPLTQSSHILCFLFCLFCFVLFFFVFFFCFLFCFVFFFYSIFCFLNRSPLSIHNFWVGDNVCRF